MTPQELVDAARQAVADWNAGRSAGPAGQALRDAVVGLLDLRAKDTDHIADLVGQLDRALADRDRAASENARQLAQVAIKTGVVLAERGEEIAALTADRDRLAADLAEHRTQSVRDAALITEARAERDRLAAQVQRIRDIPREVHSDTENHGTWGFRAGWNDCLTQVVAVLDGGAS